MWRNWRRHKIGPFCGRTAPFSYEKHEKCAAKLTPRSTYVLKPSEHTPRALVRGIIYLPNNSKGK